MMRWISGRPIGALAVLAAGTIGLASCAVPADITLSSTGEALAASRSVAIVGAVEDSAEQGAMRTAFGDAVRSALAKQAIAVEDQAPLILEMSISQRDAQSGIAESPPPGADSVTWQSEQRKKRIFDGCKAQRVRAGLLLVERATGKVAYRGTGDLNTCKSTDAQIRQLADALVDDAF